MNPTTALTGGLPAILIIGAILTAPLSWWLLRRYRVAVIRSMNTASGNAGAPFVPSAPAPFPLSGAPHLVLIDITGAAPPSLSPSARHARRALRFSRWRNGAVYAAGGLAYAVIQATTWMLTSKGGFIPLRFAWLLTVHAFPAALAIGLVAFPGRRERTVVFGLYAAALAAVGSFALARNPELRPGALIFYLLYAIGPTTILLLAFLRRRVRAVGPLVLSFVLMGVGGAYVIVEAAGTSDAFLRALVDAGSYVGLGATALFVLLHVAGFLAFAIFGWWFLGWIGRRYQSKGISEQSITIDAMMLLFGVVTSVSFAFSGWVYVLAGPISFLAYKLTVQTAFRATVRPPAFSPVLLLLRVFALGARSEDLFRKISSHWLHSGSITLIAGPDLATSTVEPQEFFAFLGRRLARRFVQGQSDLEERLAQLDTFQDPDGRYRVNQFFCHRNTWQVTMQRLAARSSVVLMDLRGFAPSNQGCLWELEQLLASVSLDRTIFVLDRTTHRPFLHESLDRLSRSMPSDSPNRHAQPAQARLFTLSGHSDKEVESLLRWIYSAVPFPAVGRTASTSMS